MKLLETDTTATGLSQCAAVVMDVGLLISRAVRSEIRRHRPASLTLPQFRALAFINAHPQSSASDLAEFLVLTRPSVSKLVDDLVKQRLVSRRGDAEDRRRLMLSVTALGKKRLDVAFELARGLIAEQLATLKEPDRAAVTRAMNLLRPRFSPSTGNGTR